MTIPRRLWLTWLGAGSASLVLRALIPPWTRFATVADDELMVRLADQIRQGHWLGTWSKYTMVKPPGYALAIVLAHALGLPPPVFSQILYLAGAVLVSAALWRLTSRGTVAAVVFVAVAFNPAMFGAPASRIYREDFLSALLVLVLGLAAMALVAIRQWLRGLRGPLAPYAWCAVLGAVLGCITITKFDVVVYAAPSAAVCLVSPFVGPERRQHRLALRRALTLMLAIAMPWAGAVEAVALANYHVYRVHLVEDMSFGEFSAAWRAWTSVRDDQRPFYVPVSRSMREGAYAVSPNARLLEPFLESQDSWKVQSCAWIRICDDASAWFVWELRDAAISSGSVHTAQEFQTFFDGLRSDIQRGCASGDLQCGRGAPAAGLQRVDRRLLSETVRQLAVAAIALAGFDSALVERHTPAPLSFQAKLWAANVRGVSSTPGASAPMPGAWQDSIVVSLRWVYAAGVWIGLAAIIALGAWRRPNAPASSVWPIVAAAALLVVLEVSALAFFDAGMGDLIADGGPLYLLPTTGPLVIAVVGAALGLSWRRS